MAKDEPAVAKPVGTGLLGALGLSARTLLLVAVIALLVVWYFQSQGMPLSVPEAAVVVFLLALVAAATRKLWAVLRKPQARASRAQDGPG